MNPPNGKYSVLVMDDEPGILLTLKAGLTDARRAECDLSHCDFLFHNPADSKENICKSKFALAVLDIVMAGSGFQNGFEAGKLLRRYHPFTKLIFISGYPRDEFETQTEALRAEKYLVKSPDAGQFLKPLAWAIRGALNGRPSGAEPSALRLNYGIDVFAYDNPLRLMADYKKKRNKKRIVLSDRGMAAKLGYRTKSTVGNIFRGEQAPADPAIFRLARVMEMNPPEKKYFHALFRHRWAASDDEKDHWAGEIADVLAFTRGDPDTARRA